MSGKKGSLTLGQWLWCKLHGICTKHGVQKELYGCHPDSCYFDCPRCVKEREDRYDAKLNEVMTVLEGR